MTTSQPPDPDAAETSEGPPPSIFRAEALARHAAGEQTVEAAPIYRPTWLRWLWLALALAVLGALWVGTRPVPTYEAAQVLLPVHECDADEGDRVVVMAEEDVLPLMEEGRDILLDHVEAGRQRVTAIQVVPEAVGPDDVGDRLGCAVDVTGLAVGRYAVALAEGGGDGTALAGGAVGRFEGEPRRLASLLPIWAAPADRAAGEGGATAGDG